MNNNKDYTEKNIEEIVSQFIIKNFCFGDKKKIIDENMSLYESGIVDIEGLKRKHETLNTFPFNDFEKVKTPKGDSLRLKAGNFNAREDAVAALAKIKAIGLSGIVIGNE